MNMRFVQLNLLVFKSGQLDLEKMAEVVGKEESPMEKPDIIKKEMDKQN